MISMSYAYLHNTFFVPGLGNVKNKFELDPKDQAGLKADSITLLDSGMVELAVKGVTFLVPATNFQCLVPETKK